MRITVAADTEDDALKIARAVVRASTAGTDLYTEPLASRSLARPAAAPAVRTVPRDRRVLAERNASAERLAARPGPAADRPAMTPGATHRDLMPIRRSAAYLEQSLLKAFLAFDRFFLALDLAFLLLAFLSAFCALVRVSTWPRTCSCGGGCRDLRSRIEPGTARASPGVGVRRRRAPAR